jgi:hypothetical protein
MTSGEIFADSLYAVLIMALVALSFWKKQMLLYFMACPVTIIYGSYILDEFGLIPLGATIILLGIYCLYLGVSKAVSRS